MSDRRAFNRLKGQAARSVTVAFGMDLLGASELRTRLEAMDEKIASKIVQNAIKPVVRMGRAEWKKGIRAARVGSKSTAFRRRYGQGLAGRSCLQFLKGQFDHMMLQTGIRYFRNVIDCAVFG